MNAVLILLGAPLIVCGLLLGTLVLAGVVEDAFLRWLASAKRRRQV